jgi:hypothetical protein
VPRAKGRVVLAGAAAVLLAAACSSKPPPPPQPEPASRRSTQQAGYVSGIAAAYYCTCSRWPGSWNELRRFDDYLHTRAEQQGESPMKRYAWADVSATVNTHADGSFIIRPKSPLNGDPGEKEENLEPIAVPTPDCSRFDRARFAGGC